MSDACTALAKARAGATALTSLVDTAVCDPIVDRIAAQRAAAAGGGLDAAIALHLWAVHLSETVPPSVAALQRQLGAHFAAALRVAAAVVAAAASAQAAERGAALVQQCVPAVC